MGFWSLFEVASMPVLQFLLVGLLGSFLASGYSNILSANARRDTNKIVFAVFTPALVFSSLAKAVTLESIISWWFMPVNIGITFLVGGILGWVAVKILKPERHLESLIIASCSAGNLGNLLLIIIPAVCNEASNPFGDPAVCNTNALTYVSLSMALGGFFIWTHTYSLMKKVGVSNETEYNKDGVPKVVKTEGEEANYNDQEALLLPPTEPVEETAQYQIRVPLLSSGKLGGKTVHCWDKIKGTLCQIVEELKAPSTIAAILGFIVGAVPWFKSLIIGSSAPLRVIEDAIALLGDGTLPCTTLILGGNLTKGLRKSVVKPSAVLAIILVRYVALPIVAIGVVKAADQLGLLPQDPLFQYVLLLQFALPPAMAIGTMAQLFDVGQEACSVIFLWTYLAAALALTVWSTVFMYLLS